MRNTIKQELPQAWWNARDMAIRNNTPIPTASPALHRVDYCVVCDNEIGSGIYSWHPSREDAEHNAAIVSGKVIPVDSIGGRVLIPPYADAVLTRAINRYLGL